jgi:hypothetical protein
MKFSKISLLAISVLTLMQVETKATIYSCPNDSTITYWKSTSNSGNGDYIWMGYYDKDSGWENGSDNKKGVVKTYTSTPTDPIITDVKANFNKPKNNESRIFCDYIIKNQLKIHGVTYVAQTVPYTNCKALSSTEEGYPGLSCTN